MSGMTSLFNRVTATVSGLSNAFFGQTPAQARLNAMMAYDQSNELFMVSVSAPSAARSNTLIIRASGFPEQGDDVFMRTLGRRRGRCPR